MVREASYASRHSGRAPPWRSHEVQVVLPLQLAHSIRQELRRHRAEGGRRFSIRKYGTIVVWEGDQPFGSLTLVQRQPHADAATVRRVEWNEAAGYDEAQVWAAVEALAQGPLRDDRPVG
jgi:hypothetical protein